MYLPRSKTSMKPQPCFLYELPNETRSEQKQRSVRSCRKTIRVYMYLPRSKSMKLQPRFLYWWLLRSQRNVRPKQRQISFLIVFILFRKKKKKEKKKQRPNTCTRFFKNNRVFWHVPHVRCSRLFICQQNPL